MHAHSRAAGWPAQSCLHILESVDCSCAAQMPSKPRCRRWTHCANSRRYCGACLRYNVRTRCAENRTGIYHLYMIWSGRCMRCKNVICSAFSPSSPQPYERKSVTLCEKPYQIPPYTMSGIPIIDAGTHRPHTTWMARTLPLTRHTHRTGPHGRRMSGEL